MQGVLTIKIIIQFVLPVGAQRLLTVMKGHELDDNVFRVVSALLNTGDTSASLSSSGNVHC